MSWKSTITITRARALSILIEDISHVGNDVLGSMLDVLADSRQSHSLSEFNNFVVSDVEDSNDSRIQ